MEQDPQDLQSGTISIVTPIPNWDRKSCPKCGGTLKTDEVRSHIAIIAENAEALKEIMEDYHSDMDTSDILFPAFALCDEVHSEFSETTQCISCEAVFSIEDIIAYLGA